MSSNLRRRILFLGPGRFPEGVWDTRSRYILPDLFEPIYQQNDIHLLTAVPPSHALPGLQQLIEGFGIQHHVCPPQSVSQPLPIAPQALNFAMRACLKMRLIDPVEQWVRWAAATARELKPDVITNAHGVLVFGYAATLAAGQVGARAVVRVPGDEIGSRLEMGTYLVGSAEHRTDIGRQLAGLKDSDAVIAMSEIERHRIATAVPGAAQRIDVIIRGVDVERFCPGPAQEKIDGPLRVLFLGRKSMEKGYDLAEATAKACLGRHGFEFIFAGTFEPGREDNRHYLGFIAPDELPDLLRSCHVLLMPSRTEGFPQVLLEAMSSQLACIVPRHLFGGVFEDGGEVLMVENTVADLKDTLLQLEKAEDLRVRLGKSARAMVKKSFNRANMGFAYADILLGQRD